MALRNYDTSLFGLDILQSIELSSLRFLVKSSHSRLSIGVFTEISSGIQHRESRSVRMIGIDRDAVEAEW